MNLSIPLENCLKTKTKKRKTELETKITEFKQETTKTFEKEISNIGE